MKNLITVLSVLGSLFIIVMAMMSELSGGLMVLLLIGLVIPFICSLGQLD